MSQILVEVRFPDDSVLYGMYNESNDQVFTLLKDTPDQVQSCIQGNKELFFECTCTTPNHEPVTVDDPMYPGTLWGRIRNGIACRKCKVYIAPKERDPS